METFKLSAALILLSIFLNKANAASFYGEYNITRPINEFGLTLFKQLSHNNTVTTNNLLISPFSIALALSLLFSASRGETQHELFRLFNFGVFNASVNSIETEWKEIYWKVKNTKEYYILSDVNIIATEFADIIFDDFSNRVKQFDTAIIDSGRDKKGNVVINKWVNDKTFGQITKLEDNCDSNGLLSLLNAVYYKGVWMYEFNKHINKTMKFYEITGGEKDVEIMNRCSKFFYLDDQQLNAKVIQIPYIGGVIQMTILLPNEKYGVLELLNQIKSIKQIDYLLKSRMQFRLVCVNVPKFRVEKSHDLRDTMIQLNVTKAFSQTSADFSDIINRQHGLYLSRVVHKVAVEVSNNGLRRESLPTASMLKLFSDFSVPDFTADHPFIYLIHDSRNSVILFMGILSQV